VTLWDVFFFILRSNFHFKETFSRFRYHISWSQRAQNKIYKAACLIFIKKNKKFLSKSEADVSKFTRFLKHFTAIHKLILVGDLECKITWEAAAELKLTAQVKCWCCGASQYIYATFCFASAARHAPSACCCRFLLRQNAIYWIAVDALPGLRAPPAFCPDRPPSPRAHQAFIYLHARTLRAHTRLHPELINSVCINSPGGARAPGYGCWRFGVSSKQSARAL
jgi:hypothetical protein